MGLMLSKFKVSKTEEGADMEADPGFLRLVSEAYFDHEDLVDPPETGNLLANHHSTCNSKPDGVVVKNETLQCSMDAGNKAEELTVVSNAEDEGSVEDNSLLENPLYNHLVLNKILSCLPLKDLTSARVVNRFWKELSELWIQREEIPFIEINAGNITQFITLFDAEKSPSFFFWNFTILDLEEINLEDCQTFFTKYGSFIKKLRVSHERNEENGFTMSWHIEDFVTAFQQKFRIVLLNVKNVEALGLFGLPSCLVQRPFVLTPAEVAANQLEKLDVLKFHAEDYPQNSLEPTEFAHGLLAMMPNVTSVDPQIQGDYRPFVNAIKNHQLVELHCLEYYDFDFFPALNNQSLEYLRIITLLQTDGEADGFYEFLQSQSSTLKILDLMAYCSNPSNLSNRFATMRELKQLCTYHAPEPEHSILNSINHPSLIPNLCRLSACMDCMRSPFLHTEFRSVHALTITNKKYQRGNASVVKTLGAMFPELRSLTFNTNKMRETCLTALFSSFQNLTTLNLIIINNRFSKDINVLLSGWPEDVEMSFFDLLRSEIDRLVLPSSIRDLKNLQVLNLNFIKYNKKRKFFLSDIGVRYGLLQIHPLDSLRISGQFEISDENVAILQNYHAYVEIDPSEPSKYCRCRH